MLIWYYSNIKGYICFSSNKKKFFKSKFVYKAFKVLLAKNNLVYKMELYDQQLREKKRINKVLNKKNSFNNNKKRKKTSSKKSKK